MVIGDTEFPTAAAAARYVSAILNRYQLLEQVSEQDATFLRALIDRHPDRDAKLRGCTITRFEVHPFTGGTRCFFLCRNDGSREHFSYKKCLPGKH
jgi:hypothetical protein